MKFLLVALFMLMGQLLFALKADSSTLDNYISDYPVKPYGKYVDTNVRLILVEPDQMVQRDKDFIVKGPLDRSHGIGSNYDSIHNVNPKVAGFISVVFLSFVGYIVWRVRRSIKKDKKNSRKNF